MANNMPDNEIYEKISHWLEEYKTTNNQKIKAKNKALIVSYMIPVVKKIAKTIARRINDPIEDLVQAGFIGLLKAIDFYSKDKNDNFRIYAGYYIIGEIKHYIRDKSRTIRVPRHIQELTIRINNFTKDLTVEEVQRLTSDEVAAALNVSQKVVDYAMSTDRRRTVISFEDVYTSSDDHLDFEEVYIKEDYKETDVYNDAKIIFKDVIAELPDYERKIMEMYYYKDMTGREIASYLGVSPMTVSRNMKKIFTTICKKLNVNREA